MATLEDKLLGEKTHYYCSSSSEGESDDEDSKSDHEGAKGSAGPSCVRSELPDPGAWEGTATNTGPKGVIKDWQRFKQLEAEKSAAKDQERLALMKKLSLTCRSSLDDELEKKKDEAGDEVEDLLQDDQFLLQYMQQRMNEMIAQTSALPNFGKLIHMENAEQFLNEIDKEHKSVTVVVHIYEHGAPGCEAMNGCLTCLSREYHQVKFCSVECSIAGVSSKFKVNGVPALLIYKGGQMIGNFVRLTDELGDDFFADDVENFLTQHGLLPDKSCIPQIIKSSAQADEDDSDLSLE